MSITIFGVVWIVFLVYAASRKDFLTMNFALILSMIFQSTNVFVLVGDTGIGPQVVTCIIWLLNTLRLNRRWKIVIDVKNISLVAFVLITGMSLLINNVLSITTFMYIIQLGIYALCVMQIYKYTELFNREDINKIIILVFWIVVIMGMIQFFMSIHIIPKFTFYRALFYNEAGEAQTIQFLVERVYPRLFSTFLEPSYCGAYLVAAFYYIISQYDVMSKNKLLIVIIFIEILLTSSTTTYAALVLGGLVYAIVKRNKKLIAILIIVACLLGLYFMVGTNFIERAINSKLSSNSGVARSQWNKNCISKFNEKKVLGWGYKQVRGSSLFYSILAQLGMIGMSSYVFMVMANIKIFSRRGISEGLQATSISIISIIISQLVACPDLDFCVFWFFMFLLAFNSGKSYFKGDVQYE